MVPRPPEMTVNALTVTRVESLFNAFCRDCHTAFGNALFSDVPDLSMLSVKTHQDFNKISCLMES